MVFVVCSHNFAVSFSRDTNNVARPIASLELMAEKRNRMSILSMENDALARGSFLNEHSLAEYPSSKHGVVLHASIISTHLKFIRAARSSVCVYISILGSANRKVPKGSSSLQKSCEIKTDNVNVGFTI